MQTDRERNIIETAKQEKELWKRAACLTDAYRRVFMFLERMKRACVRVGCLPACCCLLANWQNGGWLCWLAGCVDCQVERRSLPLGGEAPVELLNPSRYDALISPWHSSLLSVQSVSWTEERSKRRR